MSAQSLWPQGTLTRNDYSEDSSLADRLVNYSDALVALAFVGVSGLGIAVADPDVRADISRAADWVILGNVLSGALFSAGIVTLRRWEVDLRSEAAPGPKAQGYSRRLHIARLVVLWLSVLQAAVIMLAIR